MTSQLGETLAYTITTCGMTENRPHATYPQHLKFSSETPGVLDGSDSSDGTLKPPMGIHKLPITLRTYLLYFAPGMWRPIRTIRRAHVLHNVQGLQSCCSRLHNARQCVYLALAECHILPFRYWYISDAALPPYMLTFEMMSFSTIQSTPQIHCLQLHLPAYDHILQV